MSVVLEIEPVAPPLRTDETGTVRVGRTRVTLAVVIGCYKRGETAEQIAEDFDTLRLADVHGTIAYYLTHQAEVDAYLEERELRARRVREEIESQMGYREHMARFKERVRAWRERNQSNQSETD